VPSPKVSLYRVVWLVGSIIVLSSLFLPCVYDISLIATIQPNMSQMFNVISEPTMENLAFTVAVIGFILLFLSGVFCLVFSIFAFKGSKLWNVPRGIRIWNASGLGLVGMVLMSSPIFVYQNGILILGTSVLGFQYSPSLEGLGTGYILAWVGVLTSFVSGHFVLKRKSV